MNGFADAYNKMENEKAKQSDVYIKLLEIAKGMYLAVTVPQNPAFFKDNVRHKMEAFEQFCSEHGIEVDERGK